MLIFALLHSWIGWRILFVLCTYYTNSCIYLIAQKLDNFFLPIWMISSFFALNPDDFYFLCPGWFLFFLCSGSGYCLCSGSGWISCTVSGCFLVTLLRIRIIFFLFAKVLDDFCYMGHHNQRRNKAIRGGC